VISRTPGELTLHPVALGGLVVLLLNDHVLKGLAPGWLTGKLSDVAGLLFFPFLVLALVDVVRRREPGPRAAAFAAASTAAAFAAVKLWEPARQAYCGAIGALRYPVDAVTSVLSGGGAGPLALVVVTPDTSDLAAVVACVVAVVVVHRRSLRHTARRGVEVTGPVGDPTAASAASAR
jgi:hypothetical protein